MLYDQKSSSSLPISNRLPIALEMGFNTGETSPFSMFGELAGPAGDDVVSSNWSSRPDECYTFEKAHKPSLV
jgi:hypothetical protein